MSRIKKRDWPRLFSELPFWVLRISETDKEELEKKDRRR